MPRSELAYINNLHKNERRKILFHILPAWVRRTIAYVHYLRKFPHVFISSDSDVDSRASIGNDCIVWSSFIGNNVQIGQNTSVCADSYIGGEGTIHIGKFCQIAAKCYIYSSHHNHRSIAAYPLAQVLSGTARHNQEYYSRDIHIGNDVWLGREVKVLAGAIIGDGCVVGTGSVVTNKEFPPYSIIAGVPAKVIGSRFPQEVIDQLLDLAWWDNGNQIFSPEILEALLQAPQQETIDSLARSTWNTHK